VFHVLDRRDQGVEIGVRYGLEEFLEPVPLRRNELLERRHDVFRCDIGKTRQG
jgi:hypothetical protein